MTQQDLREKMFKVLFPYADTKRVSDNELIDQILALIKEAGYVKLADQTLLMLSEPMCLRCRETTFKAGWRKVLLT